MQGCQELTQAPWQSKVTSPGYSVQCDGAEAEKACENGMEDTRFKTLVLSGLLIPPPDPY